MSEFLDRKQGESDQIANSPYGNLSTQNPYKFMPLSGDQLSLGTSNTDHLANSQTMPNQPPSSGHLAWKPVQAFTPHVSV